MKFETEDLRLQLIFFTKKIMLRRFCLLLILVAMLGCSNSTNADKKIVNSSTNFNENKNSNLNELSVNKTKSENQNREITTETNEKKPETIAGTWKQIHSSQGLEGKKIYIRDYEIFWTFNKDGSGIYNKYLKGTAPESGETTKFKWKIKDKKTLLIQKEREEENSFELYEQSANYMVWKSEIMKGVFIYALFHNKEALN